MHEKVRKVIPFALGFLSCLCGYSRRSVGENANDCSIFFHGDETHNGMLDFLFRGFWCSRCDKRAIPADAQHSTELKFPKEKLMEDTMACDFIQLQSMFFNFLYNDDSEEVQLACIEVLHRVIIHTERDILLKTRSKWITCIEFLLLHRKRSLREAFCSQISCFLEGSILDCLFPEDEMPNLNREEVFLDKIKGAIEATDDIQVIETLLEASAEIMMAVDINSQLFLASLILLVDKLDDVHLMVRVIAARLINRSCYFHLRGGFELLLSKVSHVRNELFEYLCPRLVNHPRMVREFAEAVLGIEMRGLVLKMIPIVLPKLVVSQKNDEQSIIILYELAKCLDIDMVQLIVDWLPKVLAYALRQADEENLFSVLQFYHTQTGSEKQEIFAAALPALLEELVCFVDDNDPCEIAQRYTTPDSKKS